MTDESNSATGLYDQAFSESVIDSYDFDAPTVSGVEGWVCIKGGSSLITNAMVQQIKVRPQLKKRVTSIALDRSAPDDKSRMKVLVAGETTPRNYSTVFNTTTLASMQRMDLKGAELHSVQKDALRQLHYDASCKVGIKFSTPWWIVKGDISMGGTASTDDPIRTCVYPSYNLHDGPTNPAVLLCSYTLSQEVQRIGSLIGDNNIGKDEQLLELVLRDLVRLHPYMRYEDLKRGVMEYNSWDWYANTDASGAFALFSPGQFSRLYPLLCRPTADGNLHFVGEGKHYIPIPKKSIY